MAGPWEQFQPAQTDQGPPPGPWASFARPSSGRPSEAGLTPAVGVTPTDAEWDATAPKGAWSDVLPAAGAGLVGGAKDVAAAPAALAGHAPAQPAAAPYYTEPLSFRDFMHPATAAPKIAYSLAKSMPSLAGGVAGGVAGAALAPEAGPVGPLVGMAVGAGGVSAVQSLAPMLAEEMQKPGADPDKAFDVALARAGQEGLFSGATMALFGWTPFKQAAKDILLQAFAVQPAAAVAQRGVENVEQGKPVTEGMGESIPNAIVGTLLPAAVHATVARVVGGAPPPGTPGGGPTTAETVAPRVRTPEEIENQDGVGPEAAARIHQAEVRAQPQGGTNGTPNQPPMQPSPQGTQPTAVAPQAAPAEEAGNPAAAAGVGQRPDPNVTMFRPGELGIDPDRLQYKASDEKGVTGALSHSTQFEPDLSNPLTIWQTNDGQNLVANGHQRYDLATRAEAAGQPDVWVPGKVYREADGYTADYMKVLAAYQNIAEGSGTPLDAAHVLRGNAAIPEGMRLPDLPPDQQLVQQSRGLVALSPEAFGAVENGVVDPAVAAAVGARISDPVEQMAALQVLARGDPTPSQARTMVEDIVRTGYVKAQEAGQGSLPGIDDTAVQSVVPERAKVLDKALGALRSARNVYGVAVRGEGVLTDAGNVLATDANRQGKAQNERLLKQLWTDATTRGPTSDALTAAARELAAGKPIGVVSSKFLIAARKIDREGTQERVQRGADEHGAGDAGEGPVAGFTTSKGSTYDLHGDGTTTRNKSFHPEHGAADQGLKPRSQATVYVTPEQAQELSLFHTQGGPSKAISRRPDGSIGIQYLTGKDAGKFERRTVIMPRTEPAIGLHPLEIWNDGRGAHFGNPITEVRNAPKQEPLFGRRLPQPPAGPWNLFGEAAREQTPRAAEPTIRTDERQAVMPGMEPSAVQAQAARDQAGRGALGPKGEVRAADEGLFAPKPGEQKPLFQRAAPAGGETPHPDAVRAAVQTAQRITGNHVRVEALDPNHDAFRVTMPDGQVEQVFGYQIGRLIRAAIEPGRTRANLNHEAWHALEALGVIKPGEMRTLEAMALREDWLGKHKIAERYPDLDPAQRMREALAEQFAAHLDTQKVLPPGVVARVAGRIRQFFARMKNALAGNGFQTADDVFNAAGRGDIGAREPGAHGEATQVSADQAAAAMRQYEASAAAAQPAFIRQGPGPELPLGRPTPPVRDENDFRARLARLPLIGQHTDAIAQRFTNVGHTLQMMATPMAQGSAEARAMAKDFANTRRLARDESGRMVEYLGKTFSPAELKQMWEAADAESVARQTGNDPTGYGLDTLTPRQREVVEQLQDNASRSLALATRLGMFHGEGLPSYVPRMATGIGTDDPHVVRDIRTLAIATGKLNEAIAGRRLIEGVRSAGMQVGTPTVRDGSVPTSGGTPMNAFGTNLRTTTAQLLPRKHLTAEEQEAAMRRMPQGEPEDGFKWFTVKENPAFWTSRVAGTDAEGKPIWERVPVFVRSDFEGPLRAVLTKPDNAIYRGMMDLKGRVMTSIIYGVAHLGVVTGRALPASPNIIRTMREGYVAKNDPAIRNRAIANGLVPIGHRFSQYGEIGDLEKPPDLTPGRSFTAQLIGAIPGLYSKGAGDAVKRSIDRMGDFMHNTLLWNRVGDIQFGLFTSFERHLIDKGADPQSAARAAAHFANRYAGALPDEAMSQMARKIANTVLFSRTYRLGNVGAIKDMFTGLPKDVQAQISRDQGAQALDNVRSMAKRKAITTLAIDMALYYAGNSLIQSAASVLSGDNSLDDEARGYARRLLDEAKKVGSNPLRALNPFGVMQAITPMGEHEPGKENRILIGYEKDGTGIYLRNPFGKYAEDISDYWTAPLRTLHAMMSPFVRPVSAVWSNDAGFGRKLYDPNADTPPKVAGNIRDVLLDAIEGATPKTALESGQRLLSGQGGAYEAGQIVGGALGFAVSHGYPGGPAQGEMASVQEEQRYAQSKAMSGIRDKIKAGDIDGARDAMTELGMAPGMQRFEIMQALHPHATPRQAQQFERSASPEQRQALERLQRPSPTP